MLDPGGDKTKKAYIWAYARRAFEDEPGVVYDFCAECGGQYPHAFLKGWSGTLVVDAYGGYGATLRLGGRSTAHRLAHARRKFDELVKATASPVAAQAIQHTAGLYRVAADARNLSSEQRLQIGLERARPPWQDLHVWLQVERQHVPDGSAIAKAIDYSLLNHCRDCRASCWTARRPLTTITSRTRYGLARWAGAIGCSSVANWRASERAAVVTSLLQSAKLRGHDPWAYLKDVLARLPAQLNSEIEELLPHRWHRAD